MRNYFCVIPKHHGLHESTAHSSSNNSKITNHISLTGTDIYIIVSLRKILRWKKICKVNQQINYISGIV